MPDTKSIFETALEQAISHTDAPCSTMPKAGYGDVVATIPVRAGAVLIAEAKEGAGFVNVRLNMTAEQWAALSRVLTDAGASIGPKSNPNKAGYVSRAVTVKSEKNDYAF